MNRFCALSVTLHRHLKVASCGADNNDVVSQADRARTDDERDAGFTMVEQLVAMSLVVVVLLGLLAALGTGAQGIANGRQRTIATSLAKATIEKLQGSAYTSIAMNLSSTGLATDPNISGSFPNYTFEGEALVGGSTTQYKTVTTEAGATYTQSTFITAVTPASGASYRRITVIIDWTPSTSGDLHSMQFSSLVFPLDYTSYPAGSGLAESTGASVTVSGSPAFLDTETFDDVHLNMPGARATTSASTLRTAHGSASSSTGIVDVATGPVASTTCTVSGTSNDAAECALSTADNIADNDAGSQAGDNSTTGLWSFSAGSVSTPGGLQVITPAGTGTSSASTDVCASCTFGDGDGVPWAGGSALTMTSASGMFSSYGGTLTGSLWTVGSGWAPSTTANHQTTSSGAVVSTAALQAPPVDVVTLNGSTGAVTAVKVPALSVSATATSGYTPSSPSASGAAIAVEVWNGLAYQSLNVTPGVAFDSGPITTVAPIVIGDHVIQLTSQVVAQPKTVTSTGTSIKTEATAQFPALLVVTVDVAISSLTTTLPTAAFTVTFDYGRVSAISTWVQQ